MSRIEIGYAVLIAACTAWARIHHRLAKRAQTTQPAPDLGRVTTTGKQAQ